MNSTKTANLTAWGWVLTFIGVGAAIAADLRRARHPWRSDRGAYPHPNYDELE